MDLEARLLLITTDLRLRDDVALIAATVGVALESRSSWQAVTPEAWAVIMCGSDCLPPHPRFARESLLLGRVAKDCEQELWEMATVQPGLQPVPLPAAEAWLAQHFSQAVLDRSPGQVLAVAGALGGSGTSTVAYLLAAELAVRGASTLLIDTDPSPGAGIASLISPEESLTWERLSQVEGEISSTQLAAGLPLTEGVAVVSGGPGREVRDRMLEPVVRAARRVFDFVVIDLGRAFDGLVSLQDHLENVLLVAPCSARGAAAAQEVARAHPELPLMLVCSGLSQLGWSPVELSRSTGIVLAGDVPEQRWLRKEVALSGAYELLRSRRGAACIGSLLEAVEAGTQVSHE
ncbi:hypothetical protein ACHABX_12880 [Nesterenkonia halotolerans]|uniref:hypothetical protein n=1 Tax=Nesterenkonia halotolerans TaxID=225325 RepID=UPI003EE71ABA